MDPQEVILIELYNHQIQALEKTKHINKVAYFLDMGLGKTFVGSEKLNRLNEEVNIVICQKSKVDDWINHFARYYPNYNVFNGTKYDIKDFNKGILVINYDLVFRRENLLKLKGFTMLLDESSLIQNDKTKRSKFILKMKPKNVILLSGTPTNGKYENLWTQIKLLGWDITKTAYNNRYVNFRKINVQGLPIQIVDKRKPYKNFDELKSNLRKYSIFMKTEECFSLPKQNFTKIYVDKSSKYKKFEKESYINNPELVGDTTLTKILGLRLLCGAYSKEKLQAFIDLVNSTCDRIIVFYNFTSELNELKQVIKERPISEVNGQIKDLNAYENNNNSITFIQYQAGSMGLNLQKANKIIYFSPPLTSEHYEQSKKRIHRLGQILPCFYYNLICKNSIEEKIYSTLAKRCNYTNQLFEDG